MRGLEAVHVGQLEIHHHDVGLKLDGGGDALLTGSGDAHHLDRRLIVEQHPKAVTKQRVVLDHEDAKRLAVVVVGQGLVTGSDAVTLVPS